LSVNDESNLVVDKIIADASKADNHEIHESINKWHTLTVLLFFERLTNETSDKEIKFSEKYMEHLDKTYNFTKKNAEIRTKWFVFCIAQDYKKIDKDIKELLLTVGRMKFLRPIYRQLKVQGRVEFALEIFNEAKSFYHSMSTKIIKSMLSA